MAEANPKRPRDEANDDFQNDVVKRHKSYDDILSILEEEVIDESNQDLSDIFTTLEQELSSDSSAGDPLESLALNTAESDRQAGGPEEEDDRIRMMRHLLEASDDELGIPNRVESSDEGTDGGDGEGGERFGDLGEVLWEFEDEAANYYALLQSELFL